MLNFDTNIEFTPHSNPHFASVGVYGLNPLLSRDMHGNGTYAGVSEE